MTPVTAWRVSGGRDGQGQGRRKPSPPVTRVRESCERMRRNDCTLAVLPTEDTELRERLAAAVTRGPRLRLAVLFGSRATGKARPGSDVDVGIVPVNAGLPLSEELALASALSGAATAEVDLV